MAQRQPAVCIMASAERGTLYIGVTGNLKFRVWQHREGLVDGFTKRYSVKRLVWFEHYADFPSAITREKQLKNMDPCMEARTDRNGQPYMARSLGQYAGLSHEFPLGRE